MSIDYRDHYYVLALVADSDSVSMKKKSITKRMPIVILNEKFEDDVFRASFDMAARFLSLQSFERLHAPVIKVKRLGANGLCHATQRHLHLRVFLNNLVAYAFQRMNAILLFQQLVF